MGAVSSAPWRRILSTRKPRAVAVRCTLKPAGKDAASQRWSESAPRLRATTSHASERSSSRGIHRSSMPCNSFLPTRIGGFDRMVRKAMSSGTSSGVTALMLLRPRFSALRRTRSSARWLTSTAHTVAWGDASASESEIGPQPHPRSRKCPPAGGGGVLLSSTAVPASSRSGLNTPPAVVTSMSRPATVTRMVRRFSGLAGDAVK